MKKGQVRRNYLPKNSVLARGSFCFQELINIYHQSNLPLSGALSECFCNIGALFSKNKKKKPVKPILKFYMEPRKCFWACLFMTNSELSNKFIHRGKRVFVIEAALIHPLGTWPTLTHSLKRCFERKIPRVLFARWLLGYWRTQTRRNNNNRLQQAVIV